MFIKASRNIELPAPDGSAIHFVPRDFMGNVPDHFCQTPYFDALVKDGKIVLPSSTKDKAVDTAVEDGDKVLDETVKRGRRPKN